MYFQISKFNVEAFDLLMNVSLAGPNTQDQRMDDIEDSRDMFDN